MRWSFSNFSWFWWKLSNFRNNLFIFDFIVKFSYLKLNFISLGFLSSYYTKLISPLKLFMIIKGSALNYHFLSHSYILSHQTPKIFIFHNKSVSLVLHIMNCYFLILCDIMSRNYVCSHNSHGVYLVTCRNVYLVQKCSPESFHHNHFILKSLGIRRMWQVSFSKSW